MAILKEKDLLTYKREVEEASQFIKERIGIFPKIGIILGTGLGKATERIKREGVIPYKNIPHFPISTAPGHKGQIISGYLGQKPILAFEGRLHYYEGYSMNEITFPIRVMARLGIKVLVISNAAGGLNPLFEAGDIMIITDHINLMGGNPLRGPNIDEWGVRFPDMVEPYDKKFIKLIEETALKEGIKVHKGIYVAVAGPSMETAAETRFLRFIGADAVGMSSVPEVIIGVHSKLRILGLSVITNVNLPDNYKPAPIEKVIAVAREAEPEVTRLVETFISALSIQDI